MLLAFYSVGNERGYTRDSFAKSTPTEIVDALSKLPDEQWYCYDLSLKPSGSYPALNAFVEDYNDEKLDLGWWCVLIKND